MALTRLEKRITRMLLKALQRECVKDQDKEVIGEALQIIGDLPPDEDEEEP